MEFLNQEQVEAATRESLTALQWLLHETGATSYHLKPLAQTVLFIPARLSPEPEDSETWYVTGGGAR
jgi:hypothetical protein